MDVIVVGGGVAGLVAARELAIGGLSVTVIEATGVLGGRVARHTVGGIELDAGAESFATRGGSVAAYLAELGLSDAIVSPNPAGAWLQPTAGPAIPMPKTGLLGIPGSPLARDVIAATGVVGAMRAQLDVLLPRSFGANETSLGSLVRKRMGRRVLAKLVAPVAAGIHSRHPDALLVDVVSPGLRAALATSGSLSRAVRTLRAAAPAGSAVGGINGGMFRLVEALQADVEGRGVHLRMQTRVAEVAAGAVKLATGDVLEAAAVVLATRLETESAAWHAGSPATAPASSAALTMAGATATAGADIVLATLVVESRELDAAPRGTGLLVAPGPNMSSQEVRLHAKALTHATSKWPWLAERAGRHRHVIRLSYNSAPDNRTSRNSTPCNSVLAQGFAEIARVDAERLLGVAIPPASVRGFARVVWPAPAILPGPAIPVGPAAQGDSAPQSIPTPPPNSAAHREGVQRIGESVAGIGLAAVIAQARSEAVSLLTDFANPARSF